MNKSKMTVAAIGGAAGLGVLAMAYFTWSAYSAKVGAIEGDEENTGLESIVQKAESLSRNKPYPCAAAIRAIETNRDAVVAWKDEAFKLASAGDRTFKPMTASEFKSFIEKDAQRLEHLPGQVMGALMKPGFAFGPFREYIIDGKMPAEDPAKIAVLQRQWDDIATVIELLSNGGISEMLDVQSKVKAVAGDDQQDDKAKRRKAKSKAKKTSADSAMKEPLAYTYDFTFATRARGFVNAVNALETCERFAVVEDFGFAREKDVIATALGGDEAAAAKAQTGGRRRRRAAAEEEKSAEEKKAAENGIVTDPLMDAPFKVTMTVSVYDFRTLEAADAAKDSEEDAK